jgi:hypothetical protein
MKKLNAILLFLFVGLSLSTQAQQRTAAFLNNQTLTHDEAIAVYQKLADASPFATLIEYGKTDVGRPLHLFVIDKTQRFNPAELQKQKTILFVNNAIHPGEPCGVDASVKLAEELVHEAGSPLQSKLDNTVICIIPMYNIGGGLNRGCCSRANQNGPEMHGFRGNAKNLDLNRDFIKCDSENAKSFTRIYQEWMPDIFVDTHASNGADYQYTMTLITTQRNKINATLGQFLDKTMVPWLYEDMEKRGYEMAPYVHSIGKTPESGIKDYLETPRYSTGYSTLHNALGFVTETHMWKPYKERVLSTYEFLASILTFANDNHTQVKAFRNKAKLFTASQKRFDLNWELDTTMKQEFAFKGYESKTTPSKVTGLDRMYYDRDEPYTRYISYYNTYKASLKVKAPKYYVVPQGYTRVIERLQLNMVEMTRLTKDVDLDVEMYHIDNVNTRQSPYEFHYLHAGLEVHTVQESIRFHKGDYVIRVNQVCNRYIVETLEPQAPDSYFAWNFFDGILQQKEWFSDYIFEDLAEEIVANDPKLAAEIEAMKLDTAVNQNHWAILYHVYQNSQYYEPTHNRYPVGRVTGEAKLPIE